MRSLAQTITMAGPLLQLPRLVDEVTVGEVTETAARPESEPTFDQIDLKAFEMAVIVPVTRILLEDAQIDLATYLGNLPGNDRCECGAPATLVRHVVSIRRHPELRMVRSNWRPGCRRCNARDYIREQRRPRP